MTRSNKIKNASPILSAQQLAEYLGVDRHTIVDSWVPLGCPVARTADKDKGVPWGFRLAEVWRWAVEEGGFEENSLSGDASVELKVAMARKTLAQAQISELALEVRKGMLVHIDDVAVAVSDQCSKIRSRLLSLPSSIAMECHGKSVSYIEAMVKTKICEALEELTIDTEIEMENEEEIEIEEGE